MFKTRLLTTELLERWFLSRVNKTNACWLWNGASVEHGYGRLRLFGKLVYAHRLSWELYRGPIPTNMCVLHRCDTRLCVNPEHLFLGTRIDNNHDRTTKGRNGGCKLTKEQVLEIRKSTLPLVELSRMYNISKGHISDIRYGIARKDALNV